MSKKTHSVGLNFEKQFGRGVDPWYAKAERWVKKKFKNPYLQHLALGFVAWLKKIWIEGKIQMEMTSVDEQVEQIHKEWDEQTKPKVKIIETPSEVEGLNDMSIEAMKQAFYDASDHCEEVYKELNKQNEIKKMDSKDLKNLTEEYSKISEVYTVTAADKKGNTPAYQGYMAGKKNVKTGEPLYKAADHLKKEELEATGKFSAEEIEKIMEWKKDDESV